MIRLKETTQASPETLSEGAGSSVSRNRYLIQLAVVTGIYVVSAKLGLSVSVAHGSATPIWAPTGISLAALLLFGPRMWPAVAVGALLANLATPVPVPVAVAIAVGNTSEALLGWYLLQRVGFRNGLERVRDVIALVVAAAVMSTIVSATVGVTASLVAGTIAASTYGEHWTIWWVGDMMGDLLVASLLLVWVGRWGEWRRARAFEAIALLLLLVAVSAFVFAEGHWIYSFLVFPLLLWATLRFRQRGATLAVFVAAMIALWQILDGSAPVTGTDLTAMVEAFQALFGFVGVSLLIVAATTSERVEVEGTLAARERLQEQTKRALEREREAADELRSLDELKTTFLHAVSHDLRTPLTSILGLAVTLQRDDLDLPLDDRRDLAARIARNARKLDRLVERPSRFRADRSGGPRSGSCRRRRRRARPRGGGGHRPPGTPPAHRCRPGRGTDRRGEGGADRREPPRERRASYAGRNGRLAGCACAGRGRAHLRRGCRPRRAAQPADDGLPRLRTFGRGSERPRPRDRLSLVSGFAALHGGRAWVDEREGGGAAFKVFIPQAS